MHCRNNTINRWCYAQVDQPSKFQKNCYCSIALRIIYCMHEHLDQPSIAHQNIKINKRQKPSEPSSISVASSICAEDLYERNWTKPFV